MTESSKTSQQSVDRTRVLIEVLTTARRKRRADKSRREHKEAELSSEIDSVAEKAHSMGWESCRAIR
ncbi:MAG: hypothetical protein ISP90_02935 [Nevskia sp.]|nr:hypothetical protein [Nevskia sp.]